MQTLTLKAFEPCRRCGRIYEPPDEPFSPSPEAVASLRDRWNSNPPYALLVTPAAVSLGIFYLDSHHLLGLSSPGDAPYWKSLIAGLAAVVLLIEKVLRRLLPDEPVVRQD